MADEAQPHNLPEYSVSEISSAVKREIESTFGAVRVRGEIGRVSRPGSGHVYLDLKDERSVLAGVIWKGSVAGLAIRPEQGLEVICSGRLTTFPGQSRYQLVIERMEPAGVGALMALLEARKKKLEAEGLFDAARKKPIPHLPERIGVVTSPSGAVIRDILHRLQDRFPRHVLVWPVRVQGETSAAEVAAAVAGFNALPERSDGPLRRPDLLIVARGGGSIEDLWSFNEEEVARAVAASEIPVISAIGHETDTTLIDYVADRRAPTPTAAAEMAVPVRAELLSLTLDKAQRLIRAESRLTSEARGRLDGLSRGLPRPGDLLSLGRQRFDYAGLNLGRALKAMAEVKRLRFERAVARLSTGAARGRLRHDRQRLADLAGRAARAEQRIVLDGRRELTQVAGALDARRLHLLKRPQERLGHAAQLLESYSYRSVLARGYAVVRDETGAPIRGSAGQTPGTPLTIEFGDDDRLAVRVDGASGAPRAKPKKTKTPAPAQGKLF